MEYEPPLMWEIKTHVCYDCKRILIVNGDDIADCPDCKVSWDLRPIRIDEAFPLTGEYGIN